MIEWAVIGWRDAVLVAAALIGVYLVLSLMRLLQIGRARRRADNSAEPLTAKGAAAIDGPAPPAPVAKAGRKDFAEELTRSSVEMEVQRLRREGDQLRAELAQLAEEVTRLKAARNVSPMYNEAMALAQRGMSAAGIAGHCGISLGEAELVAALSRSEPEFDSHEEGEDRNEP